MEFQNMITKYIFCKRAFTLFCRPADETIPGMKGGMVKENDGGDKFKYDIV
jgi:hypothetical protein